MRLFGLAKTVLLILVIHGSNGFYQCEEYEQALSSDVDPNLIVMSSNCIGGCMGSTESGKFKASCASENDPLCNTGNPFHCSGKSCCCRGADCFDKLRATLIGTSADITCVVQRKTRDVDPPSYTRHSCGICVAGYHAEGIESRCISSSDLDRECSSATQLVGGHLACTSDMKKCCCRADNCQKEFETYFFQTGVLGKALISEPYSTEVKSSAAYPTIIPHLIACFITYIIIKFL